MPIKSTNKKGKAGKTNVSNNNSFNDLTNEDDAYNAIFSGDFGSLEIGSYINKGGKSNGGAEATEHLPDAIDFEDEDELAEDEEDMEADSNNNNNMSMNNNMTDDLGNLYNDDNNQIIGPQHVLGDSNELMMGDHPNTLLMDDGGFPNDNNLNNSNTNNNALFMIDNSGNMRNNVNLNDSTFTVNNMNGIGLNMTSGTNKSIHFSDDKNNDKGSNDQSYNLFDLSTSNRMKEATIQNPLADEEIKRNKERRDKLLLKYYFPSFKKGKILKWNSCIYRKRHTYVYQSALVPLSFSNLTMTEVKPFFPTNLKFKIQPDQKRLFNNMDYSALLNESKKKSKNCGIKTIPLPQLYPDALDDEISKMGTKKESKEDEIEEHHKKLSDALLVATDNWDEDKIINYDDQALLIDKMDKNDDEKNNKVFASSEYGWDWNEDDLVDAKLPMAKAAELDMNDEKLLLVLNKNYNTKKQIQDNRRPKSINESLILQKFNISNDHAYSILRHTHQPKVRATLSNLNIEHSQPAINLQSPFYKVNLPRSQLRFFHRPKFNAHMRIGSTITFSKLKTRKRKRDKGKSVRESFATTQDLTVGDSAPVYLMEYSEQTPLALSKFGMANKLINYYRKMSETDTMRPKLSVGETHVLGVQDKSPFWNFGFVNPGHIVPTLYNNMVRAPVFDHEPSNTDFLMVRSVGHGINRFYLRNINHLFTVGQTFPVVEIPGPNSRRVTSMKSIRLRMIVYRILNKVPERAISIEPIAKHFPDQDYGQNRQKVKEFMKYQRDGPDKGLWKLKEGEPLLDKDNTKKLLSPEQVAEVESMSQGLQFMEDNQAFNFDEKLVKLEEKLLPWNITKNFINATQMRAMVQIHGAGDPTGCGEGFSFLKTSMKGGFVRSSSDTNNNDSTKTKSGAHTYNVVEQQKAYDEEIVRTWNIHGKTLNIKNPFEELDDPDAINPTNRHVTTHRDDNKILRIVRKRRDENGIIQRSSVIIRDPRVIKGYLKGKELRKKAVDVSTLLNIDESKIENPDEIEFQKKVLQNELESLEKSQQRRAARGTKKRNHTIVEDYATASSTTNLGSPSAGNATGKGHGKNTTRRCATCGQIGHIRTNKSCPMYNGGITSNANTPAATPTQPST